MRFSISLKTSPTPTKMAVATPNREIEASPMSLTIFSSEPTVSRLRIRLEAIMMIANASRR